jgi:hypothetical protein
MAASPVRIFRRAAREKAPLWPRVLMRRNPESPAPKTAPAVFKP